MLEKILWTTRGVMRRMASCKCPSGKSATLGQVNNVSWLVVLVVVVVFRLRLLGFFLLNGQSGTISVP